MEAVLKVWGGCEDAEPLKIFTCRRLTFKASTAFEELANKVNELNESAQGKSEAEQQAIATEIYNLQVEIIQLFFPSFESADLGGVDPFEYQDFCIAIGKMRESVLNRVVKN